MCNLLVAADPIERLKEKAREVGFDVESAMDKLQIDKHDPDKYLEILKESLQQHAGSAVTVSQLVFFLYLYFHQVWYIF